MNVIEVWPACKNLIPWIKIKWPGTTSNRSTLAVLACKAIDLKKIKLNIIDMLIQQV